MNKLSLFLMVSLLLAGQTFADTATHQEPEHLCGNAQEWQQWQNLVDKYPDDDNLAAAYALRIGLCQQIQVRNIETERAISIFDHFFETLKSITEERERKERLKNQGGTI